MTYKAIFTAEATKELLDAWQWYEERQLGLGDRFYSQVSTRVEEITGNPEYFTTRDRLYREARVENFPYLLIFRLLKREQVIIILSVFHTSRKPAKRWKR